MVHKNVQRALYLPILFILLVLGQPKGWAETAAQLLRQNVGELDDRDGKNIRPELQRFLSMNMFPEYRKSHT